MTKIAFYRLNSEGPVPAGTIALQGGALVLEPADSQLLQNIAAQPVYDRKKGTWVASDAAETWLTLLPDTYRSPYLHAESVDSAPARKVKASPFGHGKGLFPYTVKGGRPCHVGETSVRTGCVPENEQDKKEQNRFHPKLMTPEERKKQQDNGSGLVSGSTPGSKTPVAGVDLADADAVTQGLSPEDQAMVEDWLHVGVPGLRGKADGDKLVDYLVRVLPSHPLYGLAVVEALDRLKEQRVQIPTPESAQAGVSATKSLSPSLKAPMPGNIPPTGRKGKVQPKVPGVNKESYFATCERDEHGHCLPKGQMGRRAPKKEAPRKDKASDQDATGLKGVLDDFMAEVGGNTYGEIKDLLSHALPGSDAAKTRRSVLNFMLQNGLRVDNAIKYIKDNDDERNALLQAISTGNLNKIAYEYSSTPLFDLNALGKITLSNDPVPGQAVCNLATQSVKMGSTSKTGDFRHELGHAIHASFGIGTGGAFDHAITKQYEKVMQRVAANPAGKQTKMTHEWYEENYGVLGSRSLDNDKENFAEHYRGYHKAVYQDKKEGGSKHLDRYRKLHPEMAKLFDTYYTASLVAQNQAGELDLQHIAKVINEGKQTTAPEPAQTTPSPGQAMVEAASQQPEPAPATPPPEPAWQEPAQEFTQALPKNGIVDVSSWSTTNASAKWAAKKIKQYEDLYHAGKWDELEQSKYVPQTAKPNNYCKTVLKAYEKLKVLQVEKQQQLQASGMEPKAKPTSQWKTIQNWQQVGGQKGSNPGAVMVDEQGTKHYVKSPSNPKHAQSEVLAAKLYELAGAGVPSVELVQTQTGLGVASKWLDGAQAFDKNSSYQKAKAQENFAIHAWLANWDAAGATFDNQVQTPDGKLVTVDCGGSLTFRAQGLTKEFAATPAEWQSLRDPTKNKNAAAIFGDMTDEQLMASAAKVAGISDAAIDALVDQFAPDDQKDMLRARLKTRRDYIDGFAAGIADKMALEKQAKEDDEYITLSGHDDEPVLELINPDEPPLELVNPDEPATEPKPTVPATSDADVSKLPKPTQYNFLTDDSQQEAGLLYSLAKKGKLDEIKNGQWSNATKTFQADLIAALENKGTGKEEPNTPDDDFGDGLESQSHLPSPPTDLNSSDVYKVAAMQQAATQGDYAQVAAYGAAGSVKLAQYAYDLIVAAKEHSKQTTPTPATESKQQTTTPVPPALPPKPTVTSKANAGAQKKFDALWNAAQTGDVAKVQAVATSADAKQSYAKAHHKYKMALLAALGQGATPTPTKTTSTPKTQPQSPAAQHAAIDATKLPEPPPAVMPENKTALDNLQTIALTGNLDILKSFNTTGKHQKIKDYKEALIKAVEDQLQAKQVSPKIDPAKFPAEPNFVSSKTAQVETNKKAIQEMLTLAKEGKIDELKAHPATPSPKLKAWKESLLANLDEQLHPPAPPEPPKPYNGQLDTLKKVYNAATWKTKALDCKKVGNFLITEEPGVPDVQFPNIVLDTEHSNKHPLANEVENKKHLDALKAMGASVRGIINKYTGSYNHSINGSFLEGTPSVDALKLGKAIMDHAPTLQTGTRVYRKSASDPAMIAKLKASVGKVLEKVNIASGSVKESTWHGNLHWKYTAGPGVKGIYIASQSPGNSGEREMLFPPGTRMLVTKVEQTTGEDAVKIHITLLPTVPEQCC